MATVAIDLLTSNEYLFNGDFINGYECVECVRDRKIKELLCPNV